MRLNYIGFPWRLHNLKEVCNALVKDIFCDYETFIALHEDIRASQMLLYVT